MSLDEQAKLYLNKRVIVQDPEHPHHNETGTTLRFETFMGRPAVVVRGDNGEDFGVFKPHTLTFLDYCESA